MYRFSLRRPVAASPSPTQPRIRQTTCRPVPPANLQSRAAPRASGGGVGDGSLARKTKTAHRNGKHETSTTGQREPSAYHLRVQSPAARGRLGRRRVTAACSAARRGGSCSDQLVRSACSQSSCPSLARPRPAPLRRIFSLPAPRGGLASPGLTSSRPGKLSSLARPTSIRGRERRAVWPVPIRIPPYPPPQSPAARWLQPHAPVRTGDLWYQDRLKVGAGRGKQGILRQGMNSRAGPSLSSQPKVRPAEPFPLPLPLISGSLLILSPQCLAPRKSIEGYQNMPPPNMPP